MKRRVIIVTDTTYRTLLRALNYVIEAAACADYDGDHDRGDAMAFEDARRKIAGSPLRDTESAAKSLRNVVHAASENSCSCAERASTHPATGHARDCFVTTNRRAVADALGVAAILKGEAA